MLRGLHLPRPTGAWVRVLIAPALIFIATAIDRSYQTDFWHHLARGRAIAEQNSLVNQDVFTYTVAGQPLQDANWLSQLFYYRLYSEGGLSLVQVVNSLTLAAMMAVLVYLCWRKSRSLLLSAALGIFTVFGLWQVLIIRPQTFSLLLFVLLYATLFAAQRRPWLLLIPPFIMAAWSNVHGGFPIGLVLIGCFTLATVVEIWWRHGHDVWRDRRTWAMSLCMAGSVLATMVNPYGWHIYEYVALVSERASGRNIDEWVPPGLHLFIGKMWMVSVLAMLVLFALPGRRPRILDVCLVVCFLPLACSSVRMVAWWLLVSIPIIAGLLADRLPQGVLEDETEHQPSWMAGAFCGLIVLAMSLSIPWPEHHPMRAVALRTGHRIEDDIHEAVQYLDARNPRKRIFSRFEWGEYLSWLIGPRYQIFMDGRIEIYPDDIWKEYWALTNGRADWMEILDRYGVDSLLLDADYHVDLLPQVKRSPQWQLVCEEGPALLFERREASDEEREVRGGKRRAVAEESEGQR